MTVQQAIDIARNEMPGHDGNIFEKHPALLTMQVLPENEEFFVRFCKALISMDPPEREMTLMVLRNFFGMEGRNN